MGMMDALGHALMDNQELHFGTANAAGAEGLTSEERWLVTLSAPLSAFNGDYVDTVLTGKDNDVLREGIADIWSVHDRASFEQTARWLVDEGQRSAYEPLWKAVGAIDKATQETPMVLRMVVGAFFPAFFQIKARKSLDYRELSARSGKPTQELAALMTGSADWVEALRKHFNVTQAEVPSLVAWDAVRLASLSRWAVQLGYIERPEFAAFAGGLTRQVRQAYGSWSQLSAAYIAGGLIWKYSDAREENLLRTNRLLLNDARSPYRSVAFAG